MNKLQQYYCTNCGATRTHEADKVIKSTCKECLTGQMKPIERDPDTGGLVST